MEKASMIAPRQAPPGAGTEPTHAGNRSVSDDSFEAIVQEVTDYCIFLLDPSGRVVSWNRGAELLKGMGYALKFRGESPPCIRIEARRDGRHRVFSVSDNGIGIADGQRDQIFDVFTWLHTRETYVGTGIGLAICKR